MRSFGNFYNIIYNGEVNHMGHLSEIDGAYLLELRQAGILEELDESNLVSHENGAIIVSCADGDQFADVFSRHTKLCSCHRESTRVHPLTNNGGALCIPRNSPLNVHRRGKNLLEDVMKAAAMKDIHTVVLYGHAPCGAAAGAGLTAKECLKLLIHAKKVVKTASKGLLKIACFFHVDWGRGKKRTYFVSATKWTSRFK